MKLVHTLISICIAGTGAFAAAADTPVLVESPVEKGTGLPFSMGDAVDMGYSSEDGICRALGYAKALEDSARTTGPMQNAIQVSDDGNILNATTANTVSHIYCMGTNPNPVRQNPVLIDTSALNFAQDSAFPIGAGGSDIGVCNYLGYERDVDGSSRASVLFKTVVLLDANGVPKKIVYDHPMLQIICLNLIDDKAPRYALPIKILSGTSLVFPGTDLPFSVGSEPDGICKAVGFQRSIPGMLENSGEATFDTVTVDAKGAAISGPHDRAINKISCQ